jgi:hypothetical protein
MRISRDSIILWLPIAGALVTYLLSAEPLPLWGYYEWLQFIAAVIATASAKLMTSPLKGEHDA